MKKQRTQPVYVAGLFDNSGKLLGWMDCNDQYGVGVQPFSSRKKASAAISALDRETWHGTWIILCASNAAKFSKGFKYLFNHIAMQYYK